MAKDRGRKKETQWLISCYYEYYCQGWEETHGYFLVRADTFSAACEKLKKKLENANRFANHTLE